MKRSVLSRVLLLTSLTTLGGVAGCGRDVSYSSATHAHADNADTPCTTDAQCASGRCDQGACVQQGAECVDGQRQCQLDQVFRCIGGAWTPQEVCADGLACIDGACSPGDARYPDLAIRLSEPNQDRVRVGDELYFRLVVSNAGVVRLDSFECTFELNPHTDDAPLLLGSSTGRSLEPGESLDGQLLSLIPLDALIWDNYTLDTRCEAFQPEERLDNNRYVSEQRIRVVAAAMEDVVDLAVYSSEPSQDRAQAGQPLNLVLVVGNDGAVNLDGYSCSFQLEPLTDDRPPIYLGDWSGDPLRSNDVRELELAYITPLDARGRYQLFTSCEALQPEERLDNNQYLSGVPILIEPSAPEEEVDLVLREASISPFVVYEGATTTVTFSVCNEGRAPSPRTQVLLNLNSGLDIEQHEIAIDRLVSGTCIQHEVVVSPSVCSSEGLSYILDLMVDPDQQVVETDEFNNSLSVFDAVRVDCDQAECRGDRHDFNDINDPPSIRVREHALVLCPGDVDRFALPLTAGIPTQVAFVLDSPVVGLMWATLEGERANGSTFNIAAVDAISENLELQVDVLPPARRYLLTINGQDLSSPVSYAIWSN